MSTFRSIVCRCRLYSATPSVTTAAVKNTTLPHHQHEASNSTVKTHATSDIFSDIETLIESLEKNPEITQEAYFASLLRSYTLAGMPDHALRLYSHMDDFGTPRSVLSFNALLSSYNTCGQRDRVPKLFDEIPQRYGFAPNKKSYHHLIKSVGNESGFKILKEMEMRNIEVNAVTYSVILEDLYKKGEVEEGEKIWKEMIEKGFSPDVGAYNARIGRASRGKPEDVLALIDEMVSNGLKPDTSSYNYLFACYGENGMVEEAKRVYRDFEKNGCLRNGATFRLGVIHFCKHGEFEKAYEVFEESVEMDKVPAFRVLKKLVKGLVEVSKRSEAKEIIRMMRGKFASSLYNDWNNIEVALGLKN